MSWYACPKCSEPLDSDYEPVDYDFFQTGAAATEAACPKCGWKGQIVFSVEFVDYWDEETGEMMSELE